MRINTNIILFDMWFSSLVIEVQIVH